MTKTAHPWPPRTRDRFAVLSTEPSTCLPTGAGARVERVPLAALVASRRHATQGSTVAIAQASLGHSRGLLGSQDREVHPGPQRPVDGSLKRLCGLLWSGSAFTHGLGAREAHFLARWPSGALLGISRLRLPAAFLALLCRHPVLACRCCLNSNSKSPTVGPVGDLRFPACRGSRKTRAIGVG